MRRSGSKSFRYDFSIAPSRILALTHPRMKPSLIVLAAGMGSRYGGLKQMDPMGPNGETVLDYSVYDAIRAGFGQVVFVIREDFAEAFREGVGARFADKIQVDYAFQKLDDLPDDFTVPEGRSKPWGTTHAVRAARDVCKGPFAVVNADDFYGSDAYKQMADFLSNTESEATPAQYAMVGYKLENTLSDHGSVNRGICGMRGDLLEDVQEVVSISRQDDGSVSGQAISGETVTVDPAGLVSMNFWGFFPSFFSHIEEHFTAFLEENIAVEKSECYIPTVVDELIAEKKADCHVLATTSTWFGVTYPDDKPHVVASIAELIEAGDYPASLNS